MFKRDLFTSIADSITFVHPGAAFVLSFEDDQEEIRDILQNLKILESRLSLFPMNNCSSSSTSGGTHWYALLFPNV